MTVDPVGGTAASCIETGVADPQGGEEDPGGNSPGRDITGLPPAMAIVWSDPSQAPAGPGADSGAARNLFTGGEHKPGRFRHPIPLMAVSRSVTIPSSARRPATHSAAPW